MVLSRSNKSKIISSGGYLLAKGQKIFLLLQEGKENRTFIICSARSTVRKQKAYRILSNSAALSNSTASVMIPSDFFAFKTYSRLSNSPTLWV